MAAVGGPISPRPRRDTLWAHVLDPADRAALDPGAPAELDRRPDVLVVGGGAMGLATAVLCRRAGIGRVLVIEADRLAAGPSGGAGGVLAPELHQASASAEFMALARRSLELYRRLDQEWAGALGLRWSPHLMLLPEGPPSPPRPRPGIEVLTAERVAELAPGLAPVQGALLTVEQARLNPLRLAAVLSRAAGTVATGVAMTGAEASHGRLVRVGTTHGDIHPGAVVFATGLAPEPWVRIPQRLVKGHLLVTEPGAFGLPIGAHTVDLGFGPTVGGGLLAGGTRDEGDFEPQVRPEVVASILRRMGELLPASKGVGVRRAWCCFRPATADGHPVIDRVPEVDNAWVTAGHDGTGILLAPATGQAIADWIAGGDRPRGIGSLGVARFG